MSEGRCLFISALLFAATPGCAPSAEQGAPTARHLNLPAGLAARVGSEAIATATVRRVADAQRLAPAAALERAVNDARYAAGARFAFDGGSVVPVLERAAWSRALLEVFRADAAARGPATDAEVAALTALRWQDFDRPETVRTTHAVARVEKPEQDAAARALALRIFDAVQGTTDPDEFIRRAQAVPHPDLDVRAERLPPITRDGRVYLAGAVSAQASNQRMDADFSAGAYSLPAGKISEPVKSVFGYHVILCEERLPELRVPLEQRRRLMADEVAKGRAERAKQELLERLSRATPIAVARSAEDLTASVRVAE